MLFLHSRQVSSWEMLLQLLCLLQRHCEEQFSPTNPKVTLTDSWGHTGPINTALSAHWLTLAWHTEKESEIRKYKQTTQPWKSQWYCLRMKVVKYTCWVRSPVCRCSGSLQADHGSPEWCYSGGVHWHTRPLLDNAGRTSYCSTVGKKPHSHCSK